MKLLTPFILAALTCSQVFGQEKPLSETDRDSLLERLKEIQETSDSTVQGRFGTAMTAFRNAMESDAATHDLYLQCIEKVRFEDEAKKTNEFREWKRKHKERTDSPGYRRALRYELTWLVLTMEAARSKGAAASMGSKCLAVLDSILKDTDDLKGQESTLQGKAGDSVFAKAYGVDNINPAEWPQSPLDIAGIYDLIIMPPLRKPGTLDELRQAWKKRIGHEGLLLESWTNEGSDGSDRKPAFEKWKMDGLPGLTWAMEVDLFNNGDEKGASIRMLEHLKTHLKHQSAPKWIAQFTTLVEGRSDSPTAE